MADYRLLKRVELGPRHRTTGKVKHYLGSEPLPPPAELRIVSFADDPGYYLLYLDSNGNELTDTYHDTLESAMEQADFEFEVLVADWKDST